MKKVALNEKHKIRLSTKDSFWLNADYNDLNVVEDLKEKYGLDEDIVEALTEEDTRPRYFSYENGMLIILRGMNLNKGEEDHDMISLRVWIDDKKIITLCHRHIKSIEIVKEAIETGKTKMTPMDCFLELADRMAEGILDAVSDINDKTDQVEDIVIKLENVRAPNLRTFISNVRRKIVSIRRYLAPHKDLFHGIYTDKLSLFDIKHKRDIREIYNKIVKSLEDLEYASDHLTVSFEELQSKTNVRMARIMYIISIVTVIFMPMGLLTSLLGINVNGIPYADAQNAFGWIALILLGICTTLIVALKKMKWI